MLPLLHLLLPRTRQLFYCHFPDLLLAPRTGHAGVGKALRALYRAPLDWAEETATGGADLLLVNSRFTAGVFADTFKRLAQRGVAPGVLYPAVVLPPDGELAEAAGAWAAELSPELVALMQGGPTFLSINRWVPAGDWQACVGGTPWCAQQQRHVGPCARGCRLGTLQALPRLQPPEWLHFAGSAAGGCWVLSGRMQGRMHHPPWQLACAEHHLCLCCSRTQV